MTEVEDLRNQVTMLQQQLQQLGNALQPTTAATGSGGGRANRPCSGVGQAAPTSRATFTQACRSASDPNRREGARTAVNLQRRRGVCELVAQNPQLHGRDPTSIGGTSGLGSGAHDSDHRERHQHQVRTRSPRRGQDQRDSRAQSPSCYGSYSADGRGGIHHRDEHQGCRTGMLAPTHTPLRPEHGRAKAEHSGQHHQDTQVQTGS